MTNIRHLHPGNPAAVQALVSSFPGIKFKRKALTRDLPFVLESVLGMLLEPDDPRAYGTACRILAATIARLKG